MHGAADLLVEEDRAHRAVDAEVRADAELAEPPRAVVGGQRALEVGVAALRVRLGDDARRGTQLTPATSTPAGLDGMSKRIVPSAEPPAAR